MLLGIVFNSNTLAIEAGHGRLRLCCSPKGKTLTNCESVDAPIADGVITDKDAVKEIISAYLYKHRLKKCRSLVTVCTSRGIIRSVKLPAMKPRDIPSWVSCNLSEIFPAALDGYVYSYRLADDEKSSLYIALLPEDISDSYADIFAGLGLVPSLVDIYQNSISVGMKRLCKITKTAGAIALADIPHNKLALIMRGKSLDRICHVECSGQHRDFSILRAHIPPQARFQQGFLLSKHPLALDIFNSLTQEGVLTGNKAAEQNLALTGLLASDNEGWA